MSREISAELRAARSRAGRLGAASKWGGQRIVRLDKIDPATAGVIRAILVAADHAAKKEAGPADNGGPASAEVRRAAVDPAS